jgi:SsrA-binding protein
MGKTKGKVESSGPKSIQNRKARFEYEIFDEFEAGIVLVGSEVKSLFNGKGNLTDSYCRVLNSEVWVIQLDIENYTHTSAYQPERRRDRKLLLHRKEIEVIDRKVREKGYSLIPLDVYFKNGKAKLRFGLGRGKAMHDKRQTLAEKDSRREVERARSGKF